MALDRFHAQVQGVCDLSCAKSGADQLEDVHFAVRQIFNTHRSPQKAVLWLCFERFLERAYGQLPAHIDAATQNIVDGGQHFFAACFFHQVTVCACAQGSLGENAFLERGVYEDR